MPIPARVAVRCKQIQRQARVPLLCPTLLPRPFATGVPTVPPRALVVGSTGDWFRQGIAGVDIGYGAPWEPGSGTGWRQHLWRNRPCCFLHFVVFRRAPGRAAIPPKARPARLGGKTGLLAAARAGGSHGGELY